MDNTAFLLMIILFGMPIIGAIYFEIMNDINYIFNDMTILQHSITMLLFVTTVIIVIFNNA